MSKILFDDGKEVELSKETESRLRETLLKKSDQKVQGKKVIYHLAIMKSPTDANTWCIFSGTIEFIENWDGSLGYKSGDEYYCAAWNYNKDEMKQIAETILKMIEE